MKEHFTNILSHLCNEQELVDRRQQCQQWTWSNRNGSVSEYHGIVSLSYLTVAMSLTDNGSVPGNL